MKIDEDVRNVGLNLENLHSKDWRHFSSEIVPNFELQYTLIPGIYTAPTMYRKVGQRNMAPENFELPFIWIKN